MSLIRLSPTLIAARAPASLTVSAHSVSGGNAIQRECPSVCSPATSEKPGRSEQPSSAYIIMASRAAYDTTSPANLRDGSAHRDTGYSTDTSWPDGQTWALGKKHYLVNKHRGDYIASAICLKANVNTLASVGSTHS
ncbi:hypothetical protein AcV5_003682 [Taiwanofungus camphoratus]|nr:hypothetical protein AcV5_003682 [Antrodia cinnamomea]